MDKKLLLLRRHPITDGLDEDELQLIAEDFQLVDVPTDQYLHEMGNSTDSFYLIVRGRFRQTVVDELGKEILQGFLKQGSQFGGLSGARDEIDSHIGRRRRTIDCNADRLPDLSPACVCHTAVVGQLHTGDRRHVKAVARYRPGPSQARNGFDRTRFSCEPTTDTEAD